MTRKSSYDKSSKKYNKSKSSKDCDWSSKSSSSSDSCDRSSSSSSSDKNWVCKKQGKACKQNSCEKRYIKTHNKKKVIHDHYFDVEEIHRYHIRKPCVKVTCESDCNSKS